MQQEDLKYTVILSSENCGKTIFFLLYDYALWTSQKSMELREKQLNILPLINFYKKGNVLGIYKLFEEFKQRTDINYIFLEVDEMIATFGLKMAHDFLVLYGKCKDHPDIVTVKDSGILIWKKEWNINVFVDKEYLKRRLKDNLISYYYTRHLLETNNINHNVFNVQRYKQGHIFDPEEVKKQFNISSKIRNREYPDPMTKNGAERTPEEYFDIINSYCKDLLGREFSISLDELYSIHDETKDRLRNINVRVD
jgi:hypothetical protein